MPKKNKTNAKNGPENARKFQYCKPGSEKLGLYKGALFIATIRLHHGIVI